MTPEERGVVDHEEYQRTGIFPDCPFSDLKDQVGWRLGWAWHAGPEPRPWLHELQQPIYGFAAEGFWLAGGRIIK